jgi:hypothetical protein
MLNARFCFESPRKKIPSQTSTSLKAKPTANLVSLPISLADRAEDGNNNDEDDTDTRLDEDDTGLDEDDTGLDEDDTGIPAPMLASAKWDSVMQSTSRSFQLQTEELRSIELEEGCLKALCGFNQTPKGLLKTERKIGPFIHAAYAGKYTGWVVKHDHRLVITWNCFMMLAISITLLGTPFDVAFLNVARNGVFFVINRILDLAYIVDTCLQCLLTYYVRSKSGKKLLVKDYHKTFQRYLGEGFYLDVVSTIPFDFIGHLASSNLCRYFGLLRLLRFFRFMRLRQNIIHSKRSEQYQLSNSISHSAHLILKSIVVASFACHLLACLWGFVAKVECSNGGSDTCYTWLQQLREGCYIYKKIVLLSPFLRTLHNFSSSLTLFFLSDF